MPSPAATATLMTPIGVVAVTADDTRLTGIRIGRAQTFDDTLTHPLLVEAIAQLGAWFAGERNDFDLPVAMCDSDAGAALRAAIAAIPYGETRTYGEVAAATATIARAVGQVCKTNRFPIVIPCHRVTSANGPEYYSAGEGPRTKRWLIDFEHDHLPRERRTRLI